MKNENYRDDQFHDDVKALYNSWLDGHGSSSVCAGILRIIHNNENNVSFEGWRSLDKSTADAAIRLLDFSRDNHFPTEGLRGPLSNQQLDHLFSDLQPNPSADGEWVTTIEDDGETEIWIASRS